MRRCRQDPHDMIKARRKVSVLLQEVYNAEQLDILAICFTCVKVLYVGGAIEHARRLVAVIEPARQACRTPMHQTLIRNEAAFLGCIQQLLQQPPPSLPCTASNNVPLIYLCGDSHCLPGEHAAGAVMQLGAGRSAANNNLLCSSACAATRHRGTARQGSI